MEIKKDSKIKEIIEEKPETIAVFQKYGLGCVGCFAAALETVEEAAEVHDIDLESFIKDLNQA